MKTQRICDLIPCLFVMFVLLLLVACGGKSPSVAYYSLASLDQGDLGTEVVTPLDISLGIGPVTVPEYLKKAQIATRVGDNRYQFDEFHRWTGLIEKDIASVLGNNLGMLLGSNKVAFFPWMDYFKPVYRVIVDIIQFDSDLEGDAVFSARWAVSDAAGKETLASGKSDYRQTLESPSYDVLVDAESLLLAEFSRDIAEQISSLSSQD